MCRRELPEVLEHTPRANAVPTGKLLRQALGQAATLFYLDRRDKPFAKEIGALSRVSPNRNRTAFGGSLDTQPVTSHAMNHLAIRVCDQKRSRVFYEAYFGFDRRRAGRYDDGVLMLDTATGFALALAPSEEPVGPAVMDAVRCQAA